MVLKETINNDIYPSDYTGLIKKCLRLWGHRIANSLGVLIIEFRDNINEKSNFKVKFYLGDKEYLVLKVKGGMGKLTRTKYLVNEDMIYRYDWRSNFWYRFFRIVNFSAKLAIFVCKTVPGGQLALPCLYAINAGTMVMKRMIKYDKPVITWDKRKCINY
ncbi:hypothetical protein SteCoe_15102 [Stentor coeruleus]|uniref:Uncharacterized protein n=1 Tax=Stentor coeruleus TaxID=5963 RepID=A0A1R2C4E0_9CILI|nr:hypothetical protein SteCoe_15102 [Stentor coeruleus]